MVGRGELNVVFEVNTPASLDVLNEAIVFYDWFVDHVYLLTSPSMVESGLLTDWLLDQDKTRKWGLGLKTNYFLDYVFPGEGLNDRQGWDRLISSMDALLHAAPSSKTRMLIGNETVMSEFVDLARSVPDTLQGFYEGLFALKARFPERLLVWHPGVGSANADRRARYRMVTEAVMYAFDQWVRFTNGAYNKPGNELAPWRCWNSWFQSETLEYLVHGYGPDTPGGPYHSDAAIYRIAMLDQRDDVVLLNPGIGHAIECGERWRRLFDARRGSVVTNTVDPIHFVMGTQEGGE